MCKQEESKSEFILQFLNKENILYGFIFLS